MRTLIDSEHNSSFASVGRNPLRHRVALAVGMDFAAPMLLE